MTAQLWRTVMIPFTKWTVTVRGAAALLLPAVHADAQVVNPATQQPSTPDAGTRPGATDTHHTWEMPPVDVIGKAPLVEEDRIGDYAQPRWTAHRRFGETRVY